MQLIETFTQQTARVDAELLELVKIEEESTHEAQGKKRIRKLVS